MYLDLRVQLSAWRPAGCCERPAEVLLQRGVHRAVAGHWSRAVFLSPRLGPAVITQFSRAICGRLKAGCENTLPVGSGRAGPAQGRGRLCSVGALIPPTAGVKSDNSVLTSSAPKRQRLKSAEHNRRVRRLCCPLSSLAPGHRLVGQAEHSSCKHAIAAGPAAPCWRAGQQHAPSSARRPKQQQVRLPSPS